MKRNLKNISTLTLTGLFALATTGFGEPSQSELTKQARVGKERAEKIALAEVPGGKIQSEEIENEHNALVWSFDIEKPNSKNITEVLVNARTGEIVSVNEETPSDQAKEAAADRRNSQP